MNTSTDFPNFLLGYPSLAAFLDDFVPAGPVVERVISPLWYVIGFVGNPISALIWLGRRTRRNNSSAIYLGVLSISDLTFLSLHLIYVLHVAWGLRLYNHPGACELFHFLFYVPQYLSTFLVLAFTAERYVAVCHPFLRDKLCTVQRALAVVACLLVFSLVLSSAQIYIWTYHSSLAQCQIRPEAEQNEHFSFASIWTWLTDLLAFVLVPLIVLAFNLLVLREIYTISRNESKRHPLPQNRNNTTSTVTLLAVSFYLILTQVNATVVVCLQYAFPRGEWFTSAQEYRQDPAWSRLFSYLATRKILEVVCLSHYACYFFIYLITGKNFRQEVLALLSTLGRRTPVLSRLMSTADRKSQYSVISSNGGQTSETCTTALTTTM